MGVDQGDQNNVEVTLRAGCLSVLPPVWALLSGEMSVKAEEGEERGAEKYLREVMGVVEEKEQRREQQRKTRRKETEQEGGARRKEAEEGGGQARRRQEAKAKKMKVEKVLVEEELVCQGPLIVTKLVFLVSLCLFLTSSALLLSDYKQKDSLALRQTVASLPSFEAPAMLKKLPDLTSIADTAREAFVQVGWLGEDSWAAARAGLLKLWERSELVAANGIQLGGRLAEAVYRKVLVPALRWLQEPRRRGGPDQHQKQQHQHHQQQQNHHQQQQEGPERKKEGGSKTGFPPPPPPSPQPSPSAGGPSRSEMERQMAAKIAATTAYLNKEREQTEGMKRKEMGEERKRTKEEKEKLAEKESSMDDFKRLQARRREAEGKR